MCGGARARPPAVDTNRPEVDRHRAPAVPHANLPHRVPRKRRGVREERVEPPTPADVGICWSPAAPRQSRCG